MKLSKNKSFKAIVRPFWESNPIHIQMLGICSALAVTVQMKTALVMALSMTFVVSTSSLVVSLIRKWIPANIRIIVELAIVSTLVIIIDEFLRAFFYDISKQLSVFVGLIITNCIVLGRTEAFALSNPPPSGLAGWRRKRIRIRICFDPGLFFQGISGIRQSVRHSGDTEIDLCRRL
jgi:Na+-transporting NADH:ubiquinone oxidoreductase subunit D